jgi:hypothetical protein
MPANPRVARHGPASHGTMREGVRLGLIVGVATWLWIVGFDFASGNPFYTMHFLGGVMAFTLFHFTLCLGYGLAVISLIHGSAREPTVMFGLIFSAILFEAGFAGLTALIANMGLGQLAWSRIFFGNAMAAGLTYAVIAHNHPMRKLYLAAEEHQQD